jgi:hypothetical protein
MAISFDKYCYFYMKILSKSKKINSPKKLKVHSFINRGSRCYWIFWSVATVRARPPPGFQTQQNTTYPFVRTLPVSFHRDVTRGCAQTPRPASTKKPQGKQRPPVQTDAKCLRETSVFVSRLLDLWSMAMPWRGMEPSYVTTRRPLCLAFGDMRQSRKRAILYDFVLSASLRLTLPVHLLA